MRGKKSCKKPEIRAASTTACCCPQVKDVQQKKKKQQHLSKESRKQTVRCDEPTTTFKNSEKKIHHLEDTIKEVVLKQQEGVE